ncbi:MAG TPA: GNAT family N-acetyltransferase [Chitinophagaceae bacterium]|nr:GNAT family N-acetyltransferase [Chitinophagaceae bacterium]
MPHILDNMIWNAITSGNRNISVINGDVGRYLPAIAPFAGMREFIDASFQQLHQFIPADSRIAISSLKKMEHDESKWKLIQAMDVTQMVYEGPVNSFVTKNSGLIVPLTEKHIPLMLELTALTKPGPFLERTIEFGNYFGIFIDGRLAAMTGQRMNPVPYMEVSAVCTHPDFRGKGYAKALMLHVMKLILNNSFIPFLHVLTSNTTAIQLYESIGFRKRTELFVDVIDRL